MTICDWWDEYDRCEKTLRVGWTIYEEVGVCIIDDGTRKLWNQLVDVNPCSEIVLGSNGICQMDDSI